MTPRALAQRRRVLFTMLTTLGFRYPPGREPPVIGAIRQYLSGWPGIGRIVAGMARPTVRPPAHALRPGRLERDLLPGRDRALADADGGVGLGAGTVDRGAAGGVGGAQAAGGGGLVMVRGVSAQPGRHPATELPVDSPAAIADAMIKRFLRWHLDTERSLQTHDPSRRSRWRGPPLILAVFHSVLS